ncbi:organic cation transporter protein isoform X1 [Anopheles arabiensis]|uniref:AGAP003039-PA n=3 Tax=gambiae species complex TaxID=44542 RepID=Q7QDB3_ANOGA|nr:organic cation transporter protein isoform X1 [Anopheles arabiensis]XP_040229731.1 organic cation transporter protein isoform X1 [Anopheles coluzzii]XP_311836.5 organic cation transporter protein isoform X1 [Anopheles gambiae]EAA07935.5 AGAP003039-PA [Anopheles gambiae str. PEST]
MADKTNPDQGMELEHQSERDAQAAKVAAKKEESDRKWSLDPIQRAMGQLGWWHILVCAVVFPLKFPVAWHQMSIIFLGPSVNYTCASDPSLDRCDAGCTSWTYDNSTFATTLTSEWDLVCGNANLVKLSQTIFMFGILVGGVVFGSLADKYGRRPPLVIAVIIQLVTGVGAAVIGSFWVFVVLRFLTAVATGGTMVTSFVLVMEIIGPKWRELFSVLYQIPFNLGHLTLAGFAYFLREWRQLQFALSIFSVLMLSYYWLVPESPRYLFTSGNVDGAVTVLEQAAKRNNLPTDTIRNDIEQYAKEKTRNASANASKGNVLDLFRTPNMRAKTLYMCFNWFVCGLAFFGVAQYIGHAGGDIYTNVAISAALELPGTLLCIYMMKAYGRKKTLIFSNTLTGISMLAIAFVPSSASALNVGLASVGLIGMSISFPTVYLYAGELFPTVVRNVGIGTASMIARFGSMIAPFVAGMGSIAYWLPPCIFGLVPLVGAFCVFFLPETQGHPLPETLEDGENFGKRQTAANGAAGVENGKH